MERFALFAAIAAMAIAGAAGGQEEGRQVLAADALLKTPVAGLERTQATSSIVPVTGESFTSWPMPAGCPPIPPNGPLAYRFAPS